MATSALQLEANRANAQHSTGPRSQSGKQKSSQNACQHNLTGGSALAPGEDPAAYEKHVALMIAEYTPGNPVAEFVVRQIADAMWRLQRCRRLEDEILASSPNPFLDENEAILKKLERLERYRQSIERTYHRFVKEWRNLVMDDISVAKAEAALDEKRVWSTLSTAPLSELTATPVRPQRRE